MRPAICAAEPARSGRRHIVRDVYTALRADFAALTLDLLKHRMTAGSGAAYRRSIQHVVNDPGGLECQAD